MDAELVVRAQAGDQGSFETVMDVIGGRLESIAVGILRDPDLAKDATQQALLSIWQRLPSLHDPARFDAWAYRIVVRACHAEWRGARRWLPNLMSLRDREPDPGDWANGVADRDQLERAFRRLSLDQRTVVVLHYYLDLPREQVGDVLGIPIGTVHSRLRHAMQALRAALDADARPATIEHPSPEAVR